MSIIGHANMLNLAYQIVRDARRDRQGWSQKGVPLDGEARPISLQVQILELGRSRRWSGSCPGHRAASSCWPVIWLSIEDARVYAAQGTHGRAYARGAWDPAAVPVPIPVTSREVEPPAVVGTHLSGASRFGVQDMVGTVWRWTDEHRDDHTRAAARPTSRKARLGASDTPTATTSTASCS